MDDLVAHEEREVLVPHVCDLEVVSALRAITRRGAAKAEETEAVLRVYSALPLERLGHLPMLSRIFELRDNFSPYDAAYAVLAESFEAPLYTADSGLARATRAHTGVEVVEI